MGYVVSLLFIKALNIYAHTELCHYLRNEVLPFVDLWLILIILELFFHA